MADQAITPISVATRGVETAAITPVALSAANDGVITPTSDKMVLILIDDGGAQTVLIKAVTAAQEAAYPGARGVLGGKGDITVVLGAAQTMAISLESSWVKALKTTDTTTHGTIRLDADGAVHAYVLSF